MQAPKTTPLLKHNQIEEKAVLESNQISSTTLFKNYKKPKKKTKGTILFSLHKVENSDPKIERKVEKIPVIQKERPKSLTAPQNQGEEVQENTLKLSRVSTYFNNNNNNKKIEEGLTAESTSETAFRRKQQWLANKAFIKKRQLIMEEREENYNPKTKHEILLEKSKKKKVVGNKISEMNKRLGFYNKMMEKNFKEIEFMKKMIETRTVINEEKLKWKKDYEQSKVNDERRIKKFKKIFKDLNEKSKSTKENNLNHLLEKKRSYVLEKKDLFKKLKKVKSQEEKKYLKSNKNIVKKIKKMKEEAKNNREEFKKSINERIAKRINLATNQEDSDIKSKEKLIKRCIEKQKSLVSSLYQSNKEHEEVKNHLQSLLKYRLDSPNKSAEKSKEQVFQHYLKSIDAVGEGMMDIVGNKKKKNKGILKKKNSYILKKGSNKKRRKSSEMEEVRKGLGFQAKGYASLNRFSRIFDSSGKNDSVRGSVNSLRGNRSCFTQK